MEAYFAGVMATLRQQMDTVFSLTALFVEIKRGREGNEILINF